MRLHPKPPSSKVKTFAKAKKKLHNKKELMF